MSSSLTVSDSPPSSATQPAVDANVLFQQALTHHQNGQLAAAQALYDDILRGTPAHADAWHMLGVLALQSGQHQAAVQHIGHAIQLNPAQGGYHINHAHALSALQQLDAAAASLDQAVALMPDVAMVHFHRSIVLHQLQRLDEAVTSYERALLLQPDHAEAHNNRGVALQALGQLDKAVESYTRAIALQPDYAAAHFNLASAQQESHQLDAALAHYDRAIALQPDYAQAYSNRGSVLKDLGQTTAAVASYDHAIALVPDYADAWANRGIALDALRKVEQAEHSYRRALEIDPALAEAHHNLALSLLTRGHMAAAMQGFRNALAVAPNRDDAHSALLLCLSSDASIGADALFAEHVRFGMQFETPLRPLWQKHTNAKDPERALKVGFVSGDLYSHAIATFIEPVLKELTRSPRLTLHAYYTHTVRDAVNQRLQTYFAHWNEVATLPAPALADKIRADGIDILIDLSGHTGLNRLLTFAHKPAPIQATWMGFPGTTGLQAIDYYFTDKHFLPPGTFDHLFTEKLAYLPASAPFLPYPDAPAVNALPALTHGHLTFGSFNKLKKFSPAVIALWAQVLRAHPSSPMVIGGMESTDNPTVLHWFAKEGIAAERLRFYPVSDMPTYLGLHHQVDICLDTFPYNGGTTTLHALWMGVPTLTLSGDTSVTRTGCAVLGHAGLLDFQAASPAEFVERSLLWAQRLDGLSRIRASLRERFLASPAGQPAVIGQGLEKAFRTMWQRWCQQLPPASFSVD